MKPDLGQAEPGGLGKEDAPQALPVEGGAIFMGKSQVSIRAAAAGDVLVVSWLAGCPSKGGIRLRASAARRR